jgi:hypothetical protein
LKKYTIAYEQFVKWVQEDMKKDRLMVNRKVFSVVFWCLVLPAVLSYVLFALRRFQLVQVDRYADMILYLPPMIFIVLYLWPTFRDLPRVFKMGGLGAIMEDSAREVRWREDTANRLQSEVRLSAREWSLIGFHLEEDIKRLTAQNRYLTILVAVVLYFMYQFLDLGSTGMEFSHGSTPMGLFMNWVDQFSQWGIQMFSIGLFTVLFYLSGKQLHKHLIRYETCVKRLARDFTEERADSR